MHIQVQHIINRQTVSANAFKGGQKMIRKTKLAELRCHKPGAPFYPFGEEDIVSHAELRVVPYPPASNSLPAACAFIRNTGTD